MRAPRKGAPKKVTAENLATLGAARLADILAQVADSRPDLKRRLRMELAAQQGPEALAAQIDRRLAAFETSRGKITWRQKPAVLRDLDALRLLIAERLTPLDRPAGAQRLWRFIDAARQVASRLRDHSDLDPIFARAAADLGGALEDPAGDARRLLESLARFPLGWKAWLPALLSAAPAALARETLALVDAPAPAAPGWVSLVRQLADAAGDPDRFAMTHSAQALATPSIAAQVAARLLVSGQVGRAGEVLRAAAPGAGRTGLQAAVDEDWETAWIDYLEQDGRSALAQEVRWTSFARTLSPGRLRDFLKRLKDFEDVEAEHRAFEIAARTPDFESGLSFLMEWPAWLEAAQMIEQRPGEAEVDPDKAQLWAAKLRRRYPGAAHRLLRRAAAAAFRRRQYKVCDELTAEADTIELA